MKNFIGAVLPDDLHEEWTLRTQGFPGGKSGLIREMVRFYFTNVPRPQNPHGEIVDENSR